MVIDALNIYIEKTIDNDISVSIIHDGEFEGVELSGDKDSVISILQDIITKIQNNGKEI